jgi:hypothetical protein
MSRKWEGWRRICDGDPMPGEATGMVVRQDSHHRDQCVFAERGKGALYAQTGLLAETGRLLNEGLGVKAAAARTGLSAPTARKLRRIILAERMRRGLGDIMCPCGKSSSHGGACSYRNPGRCGVA